jgi:hypothetical protein
MPYETSLRGPLEYDMEQSIRLDRRLQTPFWECNAGKNTKLVSTVWHEGTRSALRQCMRTEILWRLISNLDFLPKRLSTLEAIGISGRTAEDIEFGFVDDLHFLPRLLRALQAACIRRNAFHGIRGRRFY